MPISITVKSDGVLEQVRANLDKLPQWYPAIIRTHLPRLGERIVEVMRSTVEPNRYTGGLSDSITSEYDDGEQSVAIFPTVERGQYDGGLILELGTRPIPNAPYAPIAAWADFRGLPAFPVWWKIRVEGVTAHPFLQATLEASESLIDETGRRIVTDMADSVLTGAGKVSL